MEQKRILIYTNHFYPENFKVNDIAFDLVSKGMDVTLITAIPDYPIGRYYDGYGLFKKRKEIVNGVKVIRLPIIPRGSGSAFRLILNYLSFAIISFFHAFYIGFTQKFDCIFVHHVTPIFIGIPAVIVKKIQNIKIYFWNLDFWPEIVIANTGVRNKFFFNSILSLVKFIYRNVDMMLISSKDEYSLYLERGVSKDKIVFFPNWAESIFFEKSGIDLPFNMPQGFNIVFAGNMGGSQDFESVVNAIALLKSFDINWVFVGDGRKRDWLIQVLEEQKLSNKVFLPGSFDLKVMPVLFKSADVLLLSLVDEPIFTIPAKLQAYMSSGTPIVGMLNGGGQKLIREVDCGKSCNAGDYEKLSEIIIELYTMPQAERERLGQNGLVYCKDNFHPQQCLDNLSKILTK